MRTIHQEVGFSREHGSTLPHTTTEAERDVARVFAAAANCGSSTGLAGGTVTVCLRFPKLRGGAAQHDAGLLCVDRALTRVSPPLDPLQYLTATSPRVESDAPLTLVFDVQPSRVFAQEYPWKEPADARDADADDAVDHHRVDGEVVHIEAYLGSSATSAGPDGAPSRAAQQAAAAATRAATEETDALWVAAVTNKFAQLSAEDVVRARRFHWRLAYWSAERFINESTWAKPASTVKSARLSAPRHKNVLEAALSSTTTTTTTASPHFLGVPRITHADARGIEFDGLLVARTRRYAYVAVPYVLNAAATDAREVLWTLVTRVPIPAQLAGVHGPSKAGGHKRQRANEDDDEAADEPTLETSQPTTGTHFYNTAEALLHDQQSSFMELPNAAKRVVTVRVHRAHCKASAELFEPLASTAEASSTARAAKAGSVPPTCPLRFSVWLEDAALVTVGADAWSHPHVSSPNALPSCLPARVASGDVPVTEESRRASAKTPTPPFSGLNTFADLLGALSDSCARYVQNSEKFAALAQAPPTNTTTAAASEADVPPTDPADKDDAVDKAETASVDSTQAVAEETADEQPSVSLAGPAVKPDEEAAWRRSAVCKALALFTSLTDTTSVHFKKLRRHQLPPGAMQAPKMDRWDDASGLEESCNVEFKYRLSAGGVVSSANMDRIRHTLAAMASTQGGVVLVGVTDRGDLVGHPRGGVVSALRTTGFCPAMVKDSVTVKELRRPLAAVTACGGDRTESEPDSAASSAPKRAMPANWWKAAKAPAQSGAGATSSATGSTADVVITAITVQRGQAPFYTAARNAAPYVRTCASSTLMPMHTMALRILNHIAYGA